MANGDASRMTAEYVVNALLEQLRERTAVGAGTQPRPQLTVESISLAVLALRHNRGPEYLQVLHALLSARNQDGSWPAFSVTILKVVGRRRWQFWCS